MSARGFGVAVVVALVIACGGGGTSGGGGGGGGGGSASSVPAGFVHCPQSGDVTRISDKDTQGEWGYQSSKAGATGGDIEVYADNSGDCMGMPDIRKGSAKIVASAVIIYKDASTATKASGGVFGVGASQVPGAQTGSGTGFGSSSFYSYSATESMVGWVSGSKVAAVIGENVSESDFKNFANGVKSSNPPG